MKLFKSLATILLGLTLTLPVLASQVISKDSNDLALDGYDPVSYFVDGVARRGNSDNTAVYDGAIYQFANKKNRDAFKLSPERFTPQFGGFCAFSMISAELRSPNPEVFKVIEDKLYLSVNLEAQTKLVENLKSNLDKANEIYQSK